MPPAPVSAATSALKITGFKPAASRVHEIIRALLLIAIVVLIIWNIRRKEEEDIEIDNICDVVQPGTILYNAALELDEDTRRRFATNLKRELSDARPSTAQKYKKAIGISLLAGVLSEYIINGNSAKPIGIISKTIVYSAVNTMAS